MVRNYTAAKSTELTVKENEDVRIIDATAYIEVSSYVIKSSYVRCALIEFYFYLE